MKKERGALLLSCNEISKRYPQSKVLTNVSFKIYRSEIILLLGANGAGKSTLLKVLTGLSRADKGKLEFAGENFGPKHYAKIGYVAHEPLVYSTLTVAENLKLFANLLKQPQAVSVALEHFELTKLKHRLPEDLSKGEITRLALARTFIGKPDLFLLDEPSSSLDEKSSELLKNKLLEVNKNGASALIATHDLKRLMPIATRVVILKAGEIVRDTAQESLTNEAVINWYLEAQV